jgi:hypothetical protein
MQKTIITNIQTNTDKRIRSIQDTFNSLSTNPETKEIFQKLTTMNGTILYSMFNEVFPGFETLEDAEKTCNVLINTCLDDIGIYLTTRIIGKEATDKMRKITGREDIDYLEEEVVTFKENNNWMGQTDLLEYIDRQEKIYILNSNKSFANKNINVKGYGGIKFSFLGNLKERYENFSPENIQLLDENIRKYFGLV